MGFTNTIPGFVKRNPKTTLATTIALAAGVVFTISNFGGGDLFTMNNDGNASFTGAILSTTGGTIGWSVVAGANTACSATCTFACVFGVNTASATADIVDCADTTSDKCLCAGQN